MLMQVEKSVLENALDTVSKIANKSSLEYTEYVLIDVSDSGKVVCTCTDTQNTISSSFNIMSFDKGTILVAVKYLTSYIKSLKNNITIKTAKDGKNITVSCGKASFTLAALDPTIFPRETNTETESELKINLVSSELKSALRSTIYAVAKDETRPVLTGVYFDAQKKDSKLSIVALDGYRLGSQCISADTDNDLNFIVPLKAVSELEKMLPENEQDITIKYTNKFVTFTFKDVILKSSLIAGEYVKWESIVENTDGQTKTTINLNTDSLISSISRARTALIGTDKGSNLVILKVNGDSIVIESSSTIGKTKEEIKIEKMEGEPLKIAFNINYLLDALNSIAEDEVQLLLSTSVAPMLLKRIIDGEVAKNFLALILPVRLLKK